MSATYSVWLSRPTGERLDVIDEFYSVEYTRGVNAITALTLTLPGDYPLSYLALDSRIGVYRSIDGKPEYLDTNTVWLIRTITKRFSGGVKTLDVGAVSANDLLRRRIVAYNAGTAQAEQTDKADDLMKTIVKQNLGSTATDTARDLSTYLTVQANTSLGPTVTKAFARRNVYEVLQELAQDAAEQGTAIYFDIVCSPAISSTGASTTTMEFRTFKNVRGIDHTWASGVAPLVLSPEFGSLDQVVRSYDYSQEVNYAYVGGTGVKDARTSSTASNSTRIAVSPFNRCEAFGAYTTTASSSALATQAKAIVRAGRPKRTLSAQMTETPQSLYGVHWRWGDKVTAEFDGERVDCKIDAVRVSVQNGVETVRAELRAEDS